MNPIEKLFNKYRPSFQEGGKYEKLWPFFNAVDTFAFVPDHVTNKGAHIRDAIDMKRTMFMVIVALIPCTLFGMYNEGYQHFMALGMDSTFWQKFFFGFWRTLPLILVSYIVGLGVEFVFCVIKKHAIQEGFLVSGLLIPLVMPIGVPIWMVAVATAFAVLIGKEVFGGTGMNVLNVALTARAFLFFAYPTKMSGTTVWVNTHGGHTVDGFTGETFLAQAVHHGTDFFNTAGVHYANIGASFKDAFLGFIPGSFGETSALACIIGAVILIWMGIASWKIIISALVGGSAMGLLFNFMGAHYFTTNPYLTVPWWMQLVMGGFMFGIVFMATDPVTAAQTSKGKYYYGFLIGMLAIMIRVVNPAYPEGVMMAILFMNVMAPLIDHMVVQSNINKRLKRFKTAA